MQIEYALNAVNAGQPAVGIKAKVWDKKYFFLQFVNFTFKDGVVIATEKKHKSALQDETSYHKVNN